MADQNKPRDIAFHVILALVGLVVVWLLAMPLVPPVAMSTMKRFHLQSDSFATFAIQQPIPSMYNFANLAEVRDVPNDLVMIPELDDSKRRYVNHFPARLFTFADGRYRNLNFNNDKLLELTTSYRGQSLKTVIHAQSLGKAGQYEFVREHDEDQAVDVQEAQP